MIINGIQKLTLLDYPGYLACMIFTSGCNFRCPFCQNATLVKENKTDIILEDDLFAYLNKRKNILDGLVISGGEPTLQKDLATFIKKVKALGYKVKLDTNGYEPLVLKQLLDDHLVDYVAMDIKSNEDGYPKICGIKKNDFETIKRSINLLKESDIEYEFRTTIMKEYHDLSTIKDILKLIGNKAKYYLQNFKDSENVPDRTLTSFEEKELLDLKNELNELYPNVIIR